MVLEVFSEECHMGLQAVEGDDGRAPAAVG